MLHIFIRRPISTRFGRKRRHPIRKRKQVFTISIGELSKSLTAPRNVEDGPLRPPVVFVPQIPTTRYT